MKPAWDKLGEAFKDSTSVLIGDVDCTTPEGEKVCTDNGVQGYPTIKYFTAETGKEGKDYSGGRDYDGLEKFVKESLAKKCDAHTKEDCSDQEKTYIDKMTAKDATSVKKELGRLEGMKGGDMKPEKKKWLMQRIAILKDLSEPASGKDDL